MPACRHDTFYFSSMLSSRGYRLLYGFCSTFFSFSYLHAFPPLPLWRNHDGDTCQVRMSGHSCIHSSTRRYRYCALKKRDRRESEGIVRDGATCYRPSWISWCMYHDGLSMNLSPKLRDWFLTMILDDKKSALDWMNQKGIQRVASPP